MQTLSALDVLLSNSHCNCFVSIGPHKDQELDYPVLSHGHVN